MSVCCTYISVISLDHDSVRNQGGSKGIRTPQKNVRSLQNVIFRDLWYMSNKIASDPGLAGTAYTVPSDSNLDLFGGKRRMERD